MNELLERKLMEEKVKLVIKLLEETNPILSHRESGETFVEHNLRVKNAILKFIYEWETRYQPTIEKFYKKQIKSKN